MHRRQALHVFAGLALCPPCATAGGAGEGHPHWSYDGATGPDTWGGLDNEDKACSSGHQQSPIDITGSINAKQPPLKINWRKRPATIVNNGHTIQLDVTEVDTLDLGDRNFRLTQFHFHHPSEHLVAGKSFAMEVHFVHAAATGGLAVVAVLMVACKSNAVFKKIVSTMPEEEGPAVPADLAIDPGRLLPAERAYYLRGVAHDAALQRDGRLAPPCPSDRGGGGRYRAFRQAVPSQCATDPGSRPALHPELQPTVTPR